MPVATTSSSVTTSAARGEPPERKVFGSVRYMSSENTARKFDLKPYYAYVESLPTITEARSGRPS